MTERRVVYRERLEEALVTLEKFRQQRTKPFAPEFDRWERRTIESLEVLLGPQSAQCMRFSRLRFRDDRMRPSPDYWEASDENILRDDLEVAKGIIEDALEDDRSGLVPTPAPPAPSARASQATTVVIHNNLTNVLSNMVEVTVEQLLQAPEIQGLPAADRANAEAAAKELSSEIHNERRWQRIAKLSAALWSLGEPVVKNLLIPLLLEYFKLQTGSR